MHWHHSTTLIVTVWVSFAGRPAAARSVKVVCYVISGTTWALSPRLLKDKSITFVAINSKLQTRNRTRTSGPLKVLQGRYCNRTFISPGLTVGDCPFHHLVWSKIEVLFCHYQLVVPNTHSNSNLYWSQRPLGSSRFCKVICIPLSPGRTLTAFALKIRGINVSR